MDEFKENVQHDHNFRFDGAAESLVGKLAGVLGLPSPEPDMKTIEGTAEDVTE